MSDGLLIERDDESDHGCGFGNCFPDDEQGNCSCGSQHVSGNRDGNSDISAVVYNLLNEPRALVEAKPLMKIQVEVEGSKFEAIIDTGAQCGIVEESVLKRLKMNHDNDNKAVIRGLGEKNIIQTSGTVYLPLKIHGIQCKPVSFSVMPKSNCQIILGTNFFIQNKMVIDVANLRLTWKYDDGSCCHVSLRENGSRCSRIIQNMACFATQNIGIKGKVLSKIPVMVNHPEWLGNCTDCREDLEPIVLESEEKSKRLLGKIKVWEGIISTKDLSVMVSNADILNESVKANEKLGELSTISSLDEPLHILVQEPTEKNHSDERTKWSKEVLQQEIELGEVLSNEERNQIFDLLWKREKVFSVDEYDMGRTSLTSHRIELDDTTPIQQRPRRFPQSIAEEIEKQCKELMLLDIIEPSTSPWNSPIVPIRKKDGSIRLCIDYRKLNKVTKPQRFPLPNLNDTVFSLHGSRFFTCLDLVKGYYQMDLDPSCREYTAFSTSHQHYQFCRLSFGLVNAPAAFQREMEEVLKGFTKSKVMIYIDDILIIEENFQKHYELVDKVLTTLENAGMKIKPAKCQWFREEVKFLGHIVSRSGLKKAPEYVEKVLDFPVPQTVRQLREFLGLVNFQRKFIPHCSMKAAPLSRLTGGKAREKVEWTNEMKEAFEALKNDMAKNIELAFPDFRESANRLELFVDASGTGAGACLTQRQGEDDRIISFASMIFSPAQRRYSTIERELVGLRWGIKTFRVFLYGSPFVLHTDHKPLLFLHNMRMVDSRLARTLEDISEYNFEIRYCPGNKNILADALSRVAGSFEEETVQSEHVNQIPEGFTLVKEAKGGGDSLFESLWILLKDLPLRRGIEFPETAQGMREIIIDELILNVKKYRPGSSAKDVKCLKSMRLPGVFPVTEAILAASSIFYIRICVHYGQKFSVVYIADKRIPDQSWNYVHLQCVSGIHYNPLQKETSDVRLERNPVEEIIREEEVVEYADDVGRVEALEDLEANMFLRIYHRK